MQKIKKKKNKISLSLSPTATIFLLYVCVYMCVLHRHRVNIIPLAQICGHVSDIPFKQSSFKLRKLDTMQNSKLFPKDYSMVDKMTTKTYTHLR